MYKIEIKKYTSKKANRKNSDDTWYYRFQMPGLNKNGKRQYAYKGGFATRKEAGDAAEKAYVEIYGNPETTENYPKKKMANMPFSSYVKNHWWKVCEPMWKQGL